MILLSLVLLLVLSLVLLVLVFAVIVVSGVFVVGVDIFWFRSVFVPSVLVCFIFKICRMFL